MLHHSENTSVQLQEIYHGLPDQILSLQQQARKSPAFRVPPADLTAGAAQPLVPPSQVTAGQPHSICTVLPATVMVSSSFHRPQPRLPARWKHGAPLPCVHCPIGSPVLHHPTNTEKSPPVQAEPGQHHSPALWIEAHGDTVPGASSTAASLHCLQSLPALSTCISVPVCTGSSCAAHQVSKTCSYYIKVPFFQ